MILTIGHSNRPLSWLIAQLAAHRVTAVTDVRSTPYSRLHPQFNRETLRDALRAAGMSYVFLGGELGARSKDPSCYLDGKVQYDRLAQTALFRGGLDRVLSGSLSHQIALLCAEAEPLACHRTLLVARELERHGVNVEHIRADGTVESHAAAMERLLAAFGLEHQDMFRTRDTSIKEACARQEQRIAYVDEELRSATQIAAG